ncbi:MAG TPA: hypothetical protein VGL40_12625 [Bacillota bacterium]
MVKSPGDPVQQHRRHLVYLVAAGVGIVLLGLYSTVTSIRSGSLLRTWISITAVWIGTMALQENYRQWRQARRNGKRQQTWRRSE